MAAPRVLSPDRSDRVKKPEAGIVQVSSHTRIEQHTLMNTSGWTLLALVACAIFASACKSPEERAMDRMDRMMDKQMYMMERMQKSMERSAKGMEKLDK